MDPRSVQMIYQKVKSFYIFYPQDNTPTCTEEACNLRDHHQDLKLEGYRVIGVSPDSVRKHQTLLKI